MLESSVFGPVGISKEETNNNTVKRRQTWVK
jgi:hypothetical protein